MSNEDGSFNQSKVIELLAILQGKSEGDWLYFICLPGCSHLRIVSFHISCYEQSAAASGGLFIFQILVHVLVSFSTVSA